MIVFNVVTLPVLTFALCLQNSAPSVGPLSRCHQYSIRKRPFYFNSHFSTVDYFYISTIDGSPHSKTANSLIIKS